MAKEYVTKKTPYDVELRLHTATVAGTFDGWYFEMAGGKRYTVPKAVEERWVRKGLIVPATDEHKDYPLEELKGIASQNAVSAAAEQKKGMAPPENK
jgi:hypothetical protein